MSYERRVATERTPAMQAALDKRAAMMLRAHEACTAGNATSASYEADQASNKLVQEMNALATHAILSRQENKELHALNLASSDVKREEKHDVKTSNPHVAAYAAMLNSKWKTDAFCSYSLSNLNMSTAALLASHMLRDGYPSEYLKSSRQSVIADYYDSYLKNYCFASHQNDEDNDETPHPLSASTFPLRYFLQTKSGR